jgi:hypothetical protein
MNHLRVTHLASGAAAVAGHFDLNNRRHTAPGR